MYISSISRTLSSWTVRRPKTSRRTSSGNCGGDRRGCPSRRRRHYLLRLAKNECLNYLKHKGVEDRNKQKLVEALLFSETSGWSRDDEEAQARVRKCLDMLPPKQREVLTLRYFEGLKYTEIALRLGISPETVETHIKRAFRFFRNNLPTIMSIVLFYDMTDF